MRVSKRRVLKLRFSSYERCAERLKSFLLIFKLCGIFANGITEGRLKRCSRPFYVIGIFWVSVYLSYMSILLRIFVKLNHTPLTITMDFVKHFVGCVNLIFNVIIAYTSQNLFGKFFDRLDNYDHKVAHMKHRRKDNLWILWIATLLMVVFTLWLVSIIEWKKLIGIGFFVTFLDICTMIMHMFDILEKFIMLYLMLIRFKHLNSKLVPKVSWNEKEHGITTIDVTDVKIMHSILCDAQQTFNDIYRSQLLICFASLLLHVFANIHTFRKKSLLLSCAFICIPISHLLILCAICHYTAEEANKIACILIESMTALVPSGNTTVKIGVLTYFLHNRVSFDAACFIINLPLFQSIVATITTYFLVLI